MTVEAPMKSTQYLRLIIIIFFWMEGCLAQSDWWSDVTYRKQLWVAIQTFTGAAKGDYFQPGELLADQIGDGLGGRPEDAKTLPDGSRFLSAGRAHSGREWAAVVIAAGGHVTSAALINFGCHYSNEKDPNAQPGRAAPNAKRRVVCQSTPRLTIFSHDELSKAVRDAYLSWGLSHAKNIECDERRF